MEYLFTLKYQLAADDQDSDALIERLGAAGCDDALIGVGLPGRLALAFTREAESAGVAVRTALEDVQRVIPGAKLIEVAPDLVGLSDMAEVVGVSRQNMRKLMLTWSGCFPVPVHEGSTSLWHLADVLAWLQEKGNYPLAQSIVDVAEIAMQVNTVKAARRLSPQASGEFDLLVR